MNARKKNIPAQQPSYYLNALPLSPKTPSWVALEVIVRSHGDTHGVAQIIQDGGVTFWRFGKFVGNYPNFTALYKAIDKLRLLGTVEARAI